MSAVRIGNSAGVEAQHTCGDISGVTKFVDGVVGVEAQHTC
jgi:hypothetical protein